MSVEKQKINHTGAIRKYIEAIVGSDEMHSIIVEGPAGWGKTTAVEESLELSGHKAVYLGSYSTPLSLYNFLQENAARIVLLDDCAGIFNDSTSMAILKAATWPARGTRRFIKWGSTSNKANVDEFEFSGKLIIVCNSFPKTPDGLAIKSRGYSRKIDISLNEAKQLLLKAAEESKWFAKTDLARKVGEFLISNLTEASLPQISFRTLKQGYRLAEVHADSWQELFADTLPVVRTDPVQLVVELSRKPMKVKEQAAVFEKMTTLKSRSFYHYRKQAGVDKRTRG